MFAEATRRYRMQQMVRNVAPAPRVRVAPMPRPVPMGVRMPLGPYGNAHGALGADAFAANPLAPGQMQHDADLAALGRAFAWSMAGAALIWTATVITPATGHPATTLSAGLGAAACMAGVAACPRAQPKARALMWFVSHVAMGVAVSQAGTVTAPTLLAVALLTLYGMAVLALGSYLMGDSVLRGMQRCSRGALLGLWMVAGAHACYPQGLALAACSALGSLTVGSFLLMSDVQTICQQARHDPNGAEDAMYNGMKLTMHGLHLFIRSLGLLHLSLPDGSTLGNEGCV